MTYIYLQTYYILSTVCCVYTVYSSFYIKISEQTIQLNEESKTLNISVNMMIWLYKIPKKYLGTRTLK